MTRKSSQYHFRLLFRNRRRVVYVPELESERSGEAEQASIWESVGSFFQSFSFKLNTDSFNFKDLRWRVFVEGRGEMTLGEEIWFYVESARAMMTTTMAII